MREAWAEAGSSEDRLRLRYAGEEACVPGHRFGGVRDHWLFHYVLDGKGSVRIGGRTIPCVRGGGFVFFPGQEHEYRASREEPWRYAWIGFEGSLAAGALASAGVDRDRPCFRAPYSPELAALFRRAVEELSARGPSASLAADGVLRLILARLPAVLGFVIPAPGRQHGAVSYASAARRFMEEHFVRPLAVSDVARFVGLDREYLSSLFKAETGTTMKAYLTELRMERARILLAEGRLTVAQVAGSVGYREYAVFERAFKAATGTAPRSRPLS
ncbi:MAG: hypothetical protein A2Z99_08900 [Treponema sp. GWB1_62_6]|nr:MAG: hypothetical protein A2Z99_08900 [Treponema sp. GWB1_62_6]OHE73379.1 MAG: hypothetical protein A2413_19260 [Treponema sp. RIFOXYC1_FULL_61_9]